MNAGRLPSLPIFVDSPMAVRATEVFRAHAECFNEPTLRLMNSIPTYSASRRVRDIDKVHESIALNDLREPCVIISASGMCEAGRVLHHLKHNIEDPRSTVLIAGYQAADTLGRRLLQRRPEVRHSGTNAGPQGGSRGAATACPATSITAVCFRVSGPWSGRRGQVRLVHGEPECSAGAGRRSTGGRFRRRSSPRTRRKRACHRLDVFNALDKQDGTWHDVAPSVRHFFPSPLAG